MVKIGVSTEDVDNSFSLNGLDYEKGIFSMFYDDVFYDESSDVIEDKVKIGLINKKTRVVLQAPTKIGNYYSLSDARYTTLNELLTDLGSLIIKG